MGDIIDRLDIEQIREAVKQGQILAFKPDGLQDALEFRTVGYRLILALCDEIERLRSELRQAAGARDAVIEEARQFLIAYGRDHGAVIPPGKKVTPDAATMTRWCRAYLQVAIDDLSALKNSPPQGDETSSTHQKERGS